MTLFHYREPQLLPKESLSLFNESPHQYLSNELSCTPNIDRIKKLRPREIDVLTYPNRSHMTFGTSSPRVRFLDV
jgi:hypothetical protein